MIEPIARIRIELQDIEPKVWRRVDVPRSSTLMDLHHIIQVTMDWDGAHLFEFHVGDKIYGEPFPDDGFEDRTVYKAKSIRLQTLLDRGFDRFLYVYDFGDDWRHEVIVEDTGLSFGLVAPRCFDGSVVAARFLSEAAALIEPSPNSTSRPATLAFWIAPRDNPAWAA